MVVEWWSVIPFVLMLLSIAILPLVPATAHRWESRRFQLGLALLLGVPVAAWMWLSGESTTVLHSLWEYAQFILLLLSLFVVSGGIFLQGDIRATPRNNTVFIAVGTLLASLIGTTGAAMLLIRPILNTNQERKHKAHTVVFTIFGVANTGGLLTPLGDPPLFLGFLRGVPFLWTLHLLPEWLFVNALLLLAYYSLDRRLFAVERGADVLKDITQQQPLRLRGVQNLAWLALIVVAVALLPSLDLHAIEEGHATITQMVPWRELAFVLAAAMSYLTTARSIRFTDNEFSWGPIAEVAALFVGIFLTMMPALKYLTQVAPKLPLNETTLFAFSGLLTSFLDNAPTYVTFFEMARTLPGEPRVADVPEVLLVSISLGAVFCGAMTYIGNGPNFMVKAVAESRGVTMPSFGGYIVWSLRHLLPTLLAMMLIFITPGAVWTALGIALALGLVGSSLWTLRGAPTAADIESRAVS